MSSGALLNNVQRHPRMNFPNSLLGSPLSRLRLSLRRRTHQPLPFVQIATKTQFAGGVET